MHTLSVAVLAAVVAVAWCSAQRFPTPRPISQTGGSDPSSFGGTSFGTSRPAFGTSRPSFGDSSIFTSDPNQSSFPGTGQPGTFGSQTFFPGSSGGTGFFNPSTSSFGTPGTTTFSSPGGFSGQPVFLTPGNVVLGTPGTFTGQGFGTPNTFSGFGTPSFGSFGSGIPQQGGTTFNTGLGSNTGTRFPSTTQFGVLNPNSFGNGFPVFVNQGGVPVSGFSQNGFPVSGFNQGVPFNNFNQGTVPLLLSQGGLPNQGFLQTPLGFGQTPTGFSQSGIPITGFGQSGLPFGVNQNSVNGFPISSNVPLVFPPPPSNSQPGVFGSSDDNFGGTGFGSNTGSRSTVAPNIRRPSFLRGKSGPSTSSSSTSVTQTENK